MSERSYHNAPKTQGVRHVTYNVQVLPQGGMTPPLLGEGDPGESFMTVQRGASGIAGATGQTGTYVVRTKDPFIAMVTQLGNLGLSFGSGGPAAGWSLKFGVPTQQSDGTWAVWFQVYNSSTLEDLNLGDQVSLQMTFRNSITVP